MALSSAGTPFMAAAAGWGVLTALSLCERQTPEAGRLCRQQMFEPLATL